MHHTAAADLRHTAHHWAHLREQLTIPPADTWPPRESRQFVLALEEAMEAAAERAERTVLALGERPVPIRLAVLDTMRAVEAALQACADQVARWQPADLPSAERWQYHRSWRHGAPWAALWLAGSLDWLPTIPAERVATVARTARRAVDQTLGLGRREDRIPGRECACGGRLILRHGGPQVPEVQCLGCGTLWRGGAMATLLRPDAA